MYYSTMPHDPRSIVPKRCHINIGHPTLLNKFKEKISINTATRVPIPTTVTMGMHKYRSIKDAVNGWTNAITAIAVIVRLGTGNDTFLTSHRRRYSHVFKVTSYKSSVLEISFPSQSSRSDVGARRSWDRWNINKLTRVEAVFHSDWGKGKELIASCG